MVAQKYGRIITIGSLSSFVGLFEVAAYVASKAGVVGLTRALAVEWAPYNVRVNCIAPGLVKTDFARALWENPETLGHYESQTPLRRIGQPDDIGGIAVFLASKASAFVTGQTIVADGGVTIAS